MIHLSPEAEKEIEGIRFNHPDFTDQTDIYEGRDMRMEKEKRIFGWLPCPVVFVATAHGEKRDIMTASAMFVSEKEPLVAISVAKNHLTDRLISDAGAFTLIIASESQKDLALKLGSVKGEEKDKFRSFSIIPTKNSSGQSIIPEGAAAWMECTVEGVKEIKGYHVVIGRVTAEKHLGHPPLVWQQDAFFGLKPF